MERGIRHRSIVRILPGDEGRRLGQCGPASAAATAVQGLLNLYRTTLELRALLLTATADTSDCAAIDAGHDVIAYSRPGTDGRRFASYTNFGVAAVTLPAGEVVLASGDLTADGALPQDTTVWILLD